MELLKSNQRHVVQMSDASKLPGGERSEPVSEGNMEYSNIIKTPMMVGKQNLFEIGHDLEHDGSHSSKY